MGTLWSVLMGITLVTALGIVGLILMQQGKGADLGAAMGGGASGSVFGASGSGNFLSRATAILAAVFFIATLALTYLGQAGNRAAVAETTASQQQDEQDAAASVSVLERLQAASAPEPRAEAADTEAGATAETATTDAEPDQSGSGDGSGAEAAGGADADADADAVQATEQPAADAGNAGESSAADGEQQSEELSEEVSEEQSAAASQTATDEERNGKSSRYALEDKALTVYFDSGKAAVTAADVPADFVARAGFEQAVKSGKKLFISGYVDSTGNAQQNRKLAADRARAVRELLVKAGVSETAIELQKPDAIEQGSGSDARRVEVRVR